jgi:hypothetical protein
MIFSLSMTMSAPSSVTKLAQLIHSLKTTVFLAEENLMLLAARALGGDIIAGGWSQFLFCAS